MPTMDNDALDLMIKDYQNKAMADLVKKSLDAKLKGTLDEIDGAPNTSNIVDNSVLNIMSKVGTSD